MRSVLLIKLILLSAILSAQELTFTHGIPIDYKLNHYDEKYGSKDIKLTYIDTVSSTAYHISWKDEDMNIEILKDYVTLSSTIKKFDIKKVIGNPNASWKTFLNVGHKYYVVYSTSKDSEITASIQEINPDLTATGKPQSLATFQIAKEDDSYGVHLCKEGKQILFIRSYQGKIHVKSFSDSFAPLWSKTFEVKTEDMVLSSVGATEDGYLYMGGYYLKKRKHVDPFVIVYATKTQLHEINYFAAEEGVELFNFNMTALEDNEPLVACIYSKKRERGYRLYKINAATLRAEKFATQPISDEFKKATILGYRDETFYIMDIAKLQNGNIVFSIEGQVTHMGRSYGNDGESSDAFYTSPTNVISLNSTGTEVWDKIVRKFQRQNHASHLIGHYFFHSNNKVYLVYNDINQNFSLSPFAEQNSWALTYRNMYVAIAEIDEEGNPRKLHLVTKNPKEVSYFVVDQTNYSIAQTKKITDNLFRFMIKTAEGMHYSTLEVK